MSLDPGQLAPSSFERGSQNRFMCGSVYRCIPGARRKGTAWKTARPRPTHRKYEEQQWNKTSNLITAIAIGYMYMQFHMYIQLWRSSVVCVTPRRGARLKDCFRISPSTHPAWVPSIPDDSLACSGRASVLATTCRLRQRKLPIVREISVTSFRRAARLSLWCQSVSGRSSHLRPSPVARFPHLDLATISVPEAIPSSMAAEDLDGISHHHLH